MRIVLLLLMMATWSAGCTCQELIDVRAVETDDPAHVWTEADTQAWPTVHALLVAAAKGEHMHKPMTDADQERFASQYGDPAIVEYESRTFKIQVLQCD